MLLLGKDPQSFPHGVPSFPLGDPILWPFSLTTFLIVSKSRGLCLQRQIPGTMPACTIVILKWGMVIENGRDLSQLRSSLKIYIYIKDSFK